MLDKEVCFKCRMKRFKYLLGGIVSKEADKFMSEQDERFKEEWDLQYVSCHLSKDAYNILPIVCPPPEECPYKLEQLVNC